MADVAKLKKKAAEFELKKQFDKALAVYVEILDGFDSSDDEVDVGLYNRVGDLYLKQGNVADAVDYYEQAVDRYADGGFFNNAIALCNKILRNSPGRATVYYKLGKISAQKGFKSDAKVNFLEYADRMQQGGKFDEAFRALKEFADLCPDQDDIRLMLADQFSRKGRTEEAVEQLQLLHERYLHEGREMEAQATVGRMKAIDPAIEPRAGGSAPTRATAGLVFLDLEDAPAHRKSIVAKRATLGLELLDTGEHAETVAPRQAAPPVASPSVASAPAPTPELMDTPTMEPALLDGVTRAAEFDAAAPVPSAGGLLEGLETTSFSTPSSSASQSHELLDFEPTSFTPPPSAAIQDEPPATPSLLDFDMPSSEPDERASAMIELDAPASSGSDDGPSLLDVDLGVMQNGASDSSREEIRPSLHDLPMLLDDEAGQDVPTVIYDASDEDAVDAVDDGGSIGGELQFIMPDDAGGTPARGTPLVASGLNDLPLMDLELPMPGEAMLGITGSPVSGLDVERTDDVVAGEAFTSLGAESVYASSIEARSSLEMPMPSDASVEFGDVDAVPQHEEPPSERMATPPAARRSSTLMAEQSVELLQALSEEDPDDNGLRRRLAETMLESGDREGGLRELEAAMVGYERADDLVAATKLADEIVMLNPSSVRHHQKRVEYAFRTNERGRLIDAYLQLADALFRAGQVDKSRAIYQRVIDLSPDDLRAQSALESFPEPEAPAAPAPVPAANARATTAVPRTSSPSKAAATPAPPSPTPDDEYINLGDWLRDDEAPKDTRMVVEEKEPTGDEEADFQDMLRKFKQGIAENVEEEDHQSHYDLGVAFKEMGLMDEAIAEFQKALRSPTNRVPTYEALGQCFIEKEQYPMAATVLGRALVEKGQSEDQLVGVLYLLGRCAEERGQRDAALEYYQRVFVIDIQFRDVGDRLAAVEGAAS